MAYEFTKDLETGNATIDSEHRELIAAINSLLEACSSGKGRTQIAQTAKFLSDYTTRHFAHEEQLQKQSGYPDFTNHHQYHESFKKLVSDTVKELDEQGPTIVMVGKLNTSLAGWLVNHIKREDAKVAAHIKSKG